MNDLWKWLPVFEAEGLGSGGGGEPAPAADPTPAADGDTTDAAPAAGEAPEAGAAEPRTLLGGVEPDADEADAGDQEQADEEGGEEAEAAEEAQFELTTPEGMDQFQDAFDGYQGAVNDFLKANPKASARDALAWAANYQAEQVQSAMGDASEKAMAVVRGWADDARKDPEIGGSNFDTSVQLAASGLKAFGNEALRKVLDESGLGSHPEVIRAFSKVGKLTQESPLSSAASSAAPLSAAERVYGKAK